MNLYTVRRDSIPDQELRAGKLIFRESPTSDRRGWSRVVIVFVLSQRFFVTVVNRGNEIVVAGVSHIMSKPYNETTFGRLIVPWMLELYMIIRLQVIVVQFMMRSMSA